MTQEQAIDLAHRIKQETGKDALAWPLANGEWVVWLTTQIYVWDLEDWLENRNTILQLKNKVLTL